jgi:hypothetical protein
MVKKLVITVETLLCIYIITLVTQIGGGPSLVSVVDGKPRFAVQIKHLAGDQNMRKQTFDPAGCQSPQFVLK